MPTYSYECQNCGDCFDLWQSIHADALNTHDVPMCGGRVKRIMGPVRTYGIGSRGMETIHHDKIEAQWSVDMPAYRRLRHEGHQPPHLDGAAHLESTAENEFEIRSGLRYGHMPEDRIKEGMEASYDLGILKPQKGAGNG